MDCRQVRQLREKYVDGLLAPELQAQFEAHLAGCEACRADVAASRRLAAELAPTFQQALGAPRLPAHVEARLRAGIAAPPRRPALASLGGLGPALASLFIVVTLALALSSIFGAISRWPTPTPTPTATVSPSPSATVTPATATHTPQPSVTASPSPTPTPTAAGPDSIETAQDLPSDTPTPNSTPTARPSATARPNPTATAVEATATATPTARPSATALSLPTVPPTAKPSATALSSSTATPTAKPSATALSLPTATPTPSVTPWPLATPTATATPFSTPTPTSTRTATPTPTPSRTATATPTPSRTATATPTPTPTPTRELLLLVDPVTSPTDLPHQTITGETAPGATVEVQSEWGRVQGTAGPAGHFALTIDLAMGVGNHLEVIAHDGLDVAQVTTDRYGQPLFILQTSPPPLVLLVDPVTSPTDLRHQAISGETAPGLHVEITCEGGWAQGQAGPDGRFVVTVDLAPGIANHLEVAAFGPDPASVVRTTLDRYGAPLIIVQTLPSPLSLLVDPVISPTSLQTQTIIGRVTGALTHTTPDHYGTCCGSCRLRPRPRTGSTR